MKVRVSGDHASAQRAAAAHVGAIIRGAIVSRGVARILIDSSWAQSAVLAALADEQGIAWGNVDVSQAGEFAGLPLEHRASTRRILLDHLILPTRIGRYRLLNAELDPERLCHGQGIQLAATRIDVALMGIGPQGQIAFHEPPADFQSEKPYLVLGLDETRRQRLRAEGAFANLAEVPTRAISVSIRQLLKAATIVATCDGAAYPAAVRRCLQTSVSPFAPASILQTHPNATLFLDAAAAALLQQQPAL